MSAKDLTTEELRAELARRDKAATEDRIAHWKVTFACPTCGADPVAVEETLIREHRFAPKDTDGRPRLEAPWEEGVTKGADYERTVSCVNGHETRTEETRWWGDGLQVPPAPEVMEGEGMRR